MYIVHYAFVCLDNKLIIIFFTKEQKFFFLTFCLFQTNVAAFVPTTKDCALPSTTNYRIFLVTEYHYFVLFIVIFNFPEHVSPVQTDRL